MEKFIKFMYGRYGTDKLNNFLFIIVVIFFILDLFIPKIYFPIIELILLIIIVSRSLSKNIQKRRKENQIFLSLINIFKKKKIKDKDHIYKKCPKCKTILKLPLPNKRGIKHTTCPTCKKRLTVFAFKKQKIEIITKK